MPPLRHFSILVAAITSALVAGFFYAYEASVTRGLGRLGDAEYIAAMQAINDTVRNPVFALSFFGALVALPLAAALHAPSRSPRSRFLLLAAVLYVIGGVGVTFALNVPLNEQLATLDLSTAGPAQLAAERADYEEAWNAWNAVRTVGATLALACVALAALAPGCRRPSSPSSKNPSAAPIGAPMARASRPA